MKEIDFTEGKIVIRWCGVPNGSILDKYFWRGDGWEEGLRKEILKLVKRVLGKILAEEVKGVVGCRRYERSEKREGYRNGYYERALLIRLRRSG